MDYIDGEVLENPETGQVGRWNASTGKVDLVNQAAMDTSPAQAALIGMGETFHNIGRNLGLADEIPGAAEAMQDLSAVNPKSTFAGQIAPGFAPIPGGAAVQIGGGGLINYLTGDPESSAGMRVASGMAGGAIGEGLSRMADRVIGAIRGVKPKQKLVANPFTGKPMAGQAAQDVNKAGTIVSPGEAWGSDTLKGLETAIKSVPGGSGSYGMKARQKNVNKLALNVFGLGDKHKAVGDDAIDDILDVISKDFSDVQDAIPTFDVDADLADDIRDYAGVTRTYRKTLGKKGASGLAEGEPMTLTGDSAMSLRSRMLKKNKNPNESSVERGETIDALDEYIEKVAGDGLPQQWAEARAKYRFYKGLDKSLNEADVSPAKLSRQMRDWRGAEGAIGDVRKMVKGLRSGDFKPPHGTPGTANQLLGAASIGTFGALPAAAKGLGLLERSLVEGSSAGSRLSSAVARGLLSEPAYSELKE